MMSGILKGRGFFGVAGKRRAKGFPLLVISAGSPSAIHAARHLRHPSTLEMD